MPKRLVSKVKFPVQRSYAERQREKGLTHVAVWVPEADRDVLREYARKKRKAAGLV
jgi:hypothetical protein